MCLRAFLVILLLAGCVFAADEPKPTADNTISVGAIEPVKPQTFSRPIRFFLADVIDRSGKARPMMVYELRGGIFLDRHPIEIVRQALTENLKAADLLAADRDSADYLLTVYVFHFGLAEGSGMDLYGKVDLNIVVKDAKTGKSQQVTAMGTSVQGLAIRKKNIMKNAKENIESALHEALRNFLRGTQLRDAIAPPPA